MIKINKALTPVKLKRNLARFWNVSGDKILRMDREYDESKGAPVFTRQGRYTSRGWTEWTQGFQYGAALIQFDATGEIPFLELGRKKTVERMAPHLTHFGVHDHGFNNVSTYGHLLRLAREGRYSATPWEQSYYELAMKVSGSVQARRWTALKDGGFIYSFNGPHSLFADTIRSLRSLAVSHNLGHAFMGENDKRTSLLERLVQHARTTAESVVFYGEGRDAYDVRGRVAHEGIFNLNDGCFRCPNSQQGFSPFTTWTRGLAWILLGYAEQLEYLATRSDGELKPLGGRAVIESMFLKAACATADFYLENTPADGIPYWDTGAPGLSQLGNYLNKPADPFNAHEPVDSSAAAIAAQGLLRLGRYLEGKARNSKPAKLYWQAGLTVLNTLLDEPYLSTAVKHQGLILHSVYHRPNGWDTIARGQKIPNGESCMWGDYHAREVALYVQRLIDDKPYLTFF
ncbi:MAG: glycosyl hydrolase [bacterium]